MHSGTILGFNQSRSCPMSARLLSAPAGCHVKEAGVVFIAGL